MFKFNKFANSKMKSNRDNYMSNTYGKLINKGIFDYNKINRNVADAKMFPVDDFNNLLFQATVSVTMQEKVDDAQNTPVFKDLAKYIVFACSEDEYNKVVKNAYTDNVPRAIKVEDGNTVRIVPNPSYEDLKHCKRATVDPHDRFMSNKEGIITDMYTTHVIDDFTLNACDYLGPYTDVKVVIDWIDYLVSVEHDTLKTAAWNANSDIHYSIFWAACKVYCWFNGGCGVCNTNEWGWIENVTKITLKPLNKIEDEEVNQGASEAIKRIMDVQGAGYTDRRAWKEDKGEADMHHGLSSKDNYVKHVFDIMPTVKAIMSCKYLNFFVKNHTLIFDDPGSMWKKVVDLTSVLPGIKKDKLKWDENVCGALRDAIHSADVRNGFYSHFASNPSNGLTYTYLGAYGVPMPKMYTMDHFYSIRNSSWPAGTADYGLIMGGISTLMGHNVSYFSEGLQHINTIMSDIAAIRSYPLAFHTGHNYLLANVHDSNITFTPVLAVDAKTVLLEEIALLYQGCFKKSTLITSPKMQTILKNTTNDKFQSYVTALTSKPVEHDELLNYLSTIQVHNMNQALGKMIMDTKDEKARSDILNANASVRNATNRAISKAANVKTSDNYDVNELLSNGVFSKISMKVDVSSIKIPGGAMHDAIKDVIDDIGKAEGVSMGGAVQSSSNVVKPMVKSYFLNQQAAETAVRDSPMLICTYLDLVVIPDHYRDISRPIDNKSRSLFIDADDNHIRNRISAMDASLFFDIVQIEDVDEMKGIQHCTKVNSVATEKITEYIDVTDTDIFNQLEVVNAAAAKHDECTKILTQCKDKVAAETDASKKDANEKGVKDATANKEEALKELTSTEKHMAEMNTSKENANEVKRFVINTQNNFLIALKNRANYCNMINSYVAQYAMVNDELDHNNYVYFPKEMNMSVNFDELRFYIIKCTTNNFVDVKENDSFGVHKSCLDKTALNDRTRSNLFGDNLVSLYETLIKINKSPKIKSLLDVNVIKIMNDFSKANKRLESYKKDLKIVHVDENNDYFTNNEAGKVTEFED